MTPEQFARVRELFEAALPLSAGERGTLLDNACADAPWLRDEVMSLIGAHDRAAGFIEAPAHYAAARLLVDDDAATLEGRMIGPYLIRQQIGRGGMGIVYLADDTRLSRRVALKALAPGISEDSARRERLRQEARAAAALSHPGIATVYALEEIDGQLYLSCEYVPGLTLRAQLQSGPLPLPHVVDYALQLASALAAAHAQGVIHRDLKPENVVRTPSGTVKILDFGIARVEHQLPTRLTREGSILGTPAYMSPEQALGQHADFRADLFSLGLLIYELASGTNPFEADTATVALARLLDLDPLPLSQVCETGSPALDRIVATCLRKEPADRYRSTADLVTDLQRLQTEAATDKPESRAGRRDAASRADATGSTLTPRWWWQFHQVALSVVYAAMIYPVWLVRAWFPPRWGTLLLFTVLAAAVATTSIRMHLWFTSRFYPAELTLQRVRAQWWTRAADTGFTLSLLVAALTVGEAHQLIGIVFLTVAVSAAVASVIIEPATTRAAFRGTSSAARTSRKSPHQTPRSG